MLPILVLPLPEAAAHRRTVTCSQAQLFCLQALHFWCVHRLQPCLHPCNLFDPCAILVFALLRHSFFFLDY